MLPFVGIQIEMNKVIQIIPPRESIDRFRSNLLIWADDNLRVFPWREGKLSNYKIIITEIFLQRTKVETVAKFMPGFFKTYPSWKKLDKASKKELELCLAPIGLSSRRSEVLDMLSHDMVKRNGRVPCARVEIDKLPGVGQYIANAIELLCCGRASPLLDVNMARVLERYFGPRQLVDIRYDPYLQKLAKAVVQFEDPTLINFAIIDLAHLVCTVKNPRCGVCLLSKDCHTYKLEYE